MRCYPPKIANVDGGNITNYNEGAKPVIFTAGAVSIPHSKCANIIDIPEATENTLITFTGTLVANKPITLRQYNTDGVSTISVTTDAQVTPTLLTRNGAGTADEEEFLISCDGASLFHPDGGGVVRSKGV